MNVFLRLECPFIAVTKRIAKGFTSRSETHVVHSPSIDTDRRDSLGGVLCASTQSLHYAFVDTIYIPAKIVPLACGRICKPMYEMDLRLVVDPM